MNEAIMMALPAGFFVGAALNIPIGPNGALAVFRASIYGWKSVLPTAVGATLASAFYIFLGALFASNPSVAKLSQSAVFHLVGAMFLGLIAYMLYKKSHHLSKVDKADLTVPSNMSMFFSSMMVGMTNPKSIVGFPAALLSSGYEFDEKRILQCAALVALGGILSSLLWWTVFIFMSKKLTKDTNTEMVAKVTRYLAYFIGFFALTRAVKVFL